MIETSEKINVIAEALLAFQGAVEGVFKAANNPHFKSKYANLETVVDTARPSLQAVGIMFTQSAGRIEDGNMQMTTMLIHAASAQWIKGEMWIPLGKKDPQGAGSAQTYAQRYSLMAMLGLPPTDDDAETAIDRHETRPAPEKQATKNEEARKAYKALQDELRQQKSVDDLTRWSKDADIQSLMSKIPEDWKAELRAEWAKMKKEFEKAPKSAGDAVQGVLDAFSGSRVINETHVREQSPLEAG